MDSLLGGLLGLVVGLGLGALLYRRFARRDQIAELERQLETARTELGDSRSRLAEAYADLEDANVTDPVTGLFNRRFLTENLPPDLAQSRRSYENWLAGRTKHRPENADLIFFLIEIDHFENIPRKFGEGAENRVLVEMKNLLQVVFRDSDFFIRWDEQQFLVVGRFADRDSAPLLAERLRSVMANREFDQGNGTPLKATCSIGFASFPFIAETPTALDWEDVLQLAQWCLRAARASGRDAWVGLDPDPDSITPRAAEALPGQPRSLIESEQLRIHSSVEERGGVVWPGD